MKLVANQAVSSFVGGKRWWALMGVIWTCAFVFAWATLFDHAYTPAKTPHGTAPTLSIEPSDSYRIVIFAHPFCPCTRATLNELDESLARLPRNTSVNVIFVSVGLNADASESSLVRLAREIRGVTVNFDETGHEAHRFGATVSGEAFAFNPAGQIVYHGGLTPGRGHQGDAMGQERLEQIIRGNSHELCIAPVYGCTLPRK